MNRAFKQVYGLVWAALREIFDENAYSRFLAREKLTPSRDAYQRFAAERARQHERRARCC